MLNDQEFQDYLRKRGLSYEARKQVQFIRSEDASRRVNSSAVNVACRYASRKMRRIIQAESHTNELPAVVLWDHDDITRELYDQPPKIKIGYVNGDGRKVTHLITPDFFLLQENFTGWIECKTEDELRKKLAEGTGLYAYEDGQWRCPPGEEYAKSVGLEFRMRSSKENNPILVRNINFLSDYLDANCPPPKPEIVELIQKIFEENAWVQLRELLQGDGIEADALYKMVADGLLYVDLERDPLTEHEHTYVFRDQIAADAHRMYLDSLQLDKVSKTRPVRLANGQSFVWDGVPWEIINVGTDLIYFRNREGRVSKLPPSLIEQMVLDGDITGSPESEDAIRKEAEDKIRKASATDLAHARARYRSLFPEDGQPVTVSERAIFKWKKLFEEAKDLFGDGFLGLIPNIHLKGNRSARFSERVIEVMNQVIDDFHAKPDQKNVSRSYGEFTARCEDEGLVGIPSEVSFRNAIKKRPQYLLKVAREGKKAAYGIKDLVSHLILKFTTPRHGERPYEIGHIDHTLLDLEFVNSRGGNLGRAWLTVLLDAYTRCVLAWVLSFEPPSYRSCMTVMRECVRRHGRLTKNVVTDKGAEFEGDFFEDLLARAECNKKTRPASKPRFGSVIERFFGIQNKEFVHNLLGNSQALQKPRSMSKSHDPRELGVWTLTEFENAFENYVENAYSTKEHPALGMSPKEAMAAGLQQMGGRAHTKIAYMRDFVFQTLPTTRKKKAQVVAGRGVKINGIYYTCPAFRNSQHAGESLKVRYDPYDISTAYVEIKGKWEECRSEYAGELEGCTEKLRKLISNELRAKGIRGGKMRKHNLAHLAREFRKTVETQERLQAQVDAAKQYSTRNQLRVIEGGAPDQLPQEIEAVPTVLDSSKRSEKNDNVILGDF